VGFEELKFQTSKMKINISIPYARNLTSDTAEALQIYCTLIIKIDSIYKNTNQSSIRYLYHLMGNRIGKRERTAIGVSSTRYMRDAQARQCLDLLFQQDLAIPVPIFYIGSYAESYRLGNLGIETNRNWNFTTNSALSPAPNVQTASASNTGGLALGGVATRTNFIFDTTPPASTPPSFTAIPIEVATQTNLTINYSLESAANNIAVTAGGRTFNVLAGTGHGSSCPIPLAGPRGNQRITISKADPASTIGGFNATVSSSTTNTYTDPAARNSTPGAVPAIPTSP
jgi:hypothetical protein